MGAKIMLCDPHRAVVMGHDFQSQLKATTMSSDIRAGISLLIAALSAKEQVPYKTLSKLIVVMKELTND
jgi:UDP-N-acetylglucosamine enolpyruvyl transferase